MQQQIAQQASQPKQVVAPPQPASNLTQQNSSANGTKLAQQKFPLDSPMSIMGGMNSMESTLGGVPLGFHNNPYDDPHSEE